MSSGLCQYKNIFGQPNEGVHSIRIPFPGLKNGIALVDTVLTLLAAYLIVYWMANGGKVKYMKVGFVFLVLMVLSVVVHKMFCVDTPLTKLL